MTQLLSSTIIGKTFSVWFAQGFSSQRDLLIALNKSSIKPHISTIASHSQPRDEILSMADIAVIEPATESPYFILAEAVDQKIQLVLTSHSNDKYELLRPEFEKYGITLITGTQGLGAHQKLENKFEFTNCCKLANIPVVEAIEVETTEELKQAIEQISQQGKQVCVKPVIGVFAQGFWLLKDGISFFQTLMEPINYQANTQQFIQAYDQEQDKLPYLVMPFLSGDECSVDMFCVKGVVMSKVTRIKKQQWQEVLPNGPCDELVKKLAEVFILDGIINAQFRQDEFGKWYVLEVNTRPSGGIGMTLSSGINLVAECVAYYAKLPLVRSEPRAALVRSISQAVEVKPLNYFNELNYA